MKIAVVSDIHGNKEALNAVLEDINNRGCDKIFVLGDYAMAGPEPCEVVEYFMAQAGNPNYKMIQGNTDVMISNYNEELYNKLKEVAPVMASALVKDAAELNPFHRVFLKNLPEQMKVEEGGVKFLLVHGSPRKNNEDIMPDLSLDKVEEMLVNVDADVILCGHTHIPCGFQTRNKKTVINVGSVGRPFTPKPQACYLVIEVEDGRCVFEHHFIDYDIETAAKKLEKRDFQGSEKLANTLRNPQERHF